MSTGRRWQDVKTKAHRRSPELADPERQAKARAELEQSRRHNKAMLQIEPGLPVQA
jgi:hypothetical protein